MTEAVPIPAAARVLELDAGNTRTKWRWLGAAGEVVAAGAWARSEAVLPAWALPSQVSGIRVRAVSVAGVEHDDALTNALTEQGLPAPVFARAQDRRGRLTSGYLSPERLGADRWVAMLAGAARTQAPFLVVDAGSAITVDLVDQNGCHAGGWIVPGLAMLRRALLAETAGIRFDDAQVESDGPGRSTADAVLAGTLRMARDFVAARACGMRKRHPTLDVFVTGGDGALIAEAMGDSVEAVPELVLDGLRHAVDG